MGPVPEDKLPKDATFGRTLTGTLALAKADGGAKGGYAPGKIQLSYRCAPPTAGTCLLVVQRSAPAISVYSDVLNVSGTWSQGCSTHLAVHCAWEVLSGSLGCM